MEVEFAHDVLYIVNVMVFGDKLRICSEECWMFYVHCASKGDMYLSLAPKTLIAQML